MLGLLPPPALLATQRLAPQRPLIHFLCMPSLFG